MKFTNRLFKFLIVNLVLTGSILLSACSVPTLFTPTETAPAVKATPVAPPVSKKRPENQHNRIPFTEQLRNDWKFTDEEIKSLQFYVHDDVLISRHVTNGSRGIVKGKLVSRYGKLIDEIELPAGTPGIVILAKEDRLYICFEGDCTATLTFGCSASCINNKEGRYNTFANDWDGNVARVDYGGESYWMKPSTYVEIDRSALDNVEKNRRVIPGKRLGYEQ